MMGKPGHTGITRIVNAAFYSLAGFKAAWANEAAFRQEVALTVLLFPAAFYFGNTGIEYALLVGSLLLVLVVELLNSAVEAVVDRVSTDRHELSGRAKDIGSAAVLLSLINLATVWGLVLFG